MSGHDASPIGVDTPAASQTVDNAIDEATALYQQGVALMANDLFAEAEVLLRRSVDLHPSAMGLLALAGAQWSQNAYEACVENLERLLASGPL